MKKITAIFLFIVFITSCSSLQTKEAKQLEDVKAVLLTHFQEQFRVNAQRKTGLKKDFIYFQVSSRPNLESITIDDLKSQNFNKEDSVYETFFSDEAISYYKTQKSTVDIKAIETSLISDKFKSKRIREEASNGLVQLYYRHTYHATLPVFTKTGNYALISTSSEGGPLHISIYKKQDKKWSIYQYFLIGFP